MSDREIGVAEQLPFFPDQPSRLHYGKAVRRHAWLVGLVVLLALGVATIITSLQSNVYRATTSLIVIQPGDTDLRGQVGDIGLTQTVAGLAETDVVADSVIQQLKLNTTVEKFLTKFKITVRPSASVIDVTFDSTSKTQAVEVLETFNSVFINRVTKDLVAQRASTTESLLGVKIFSAPRLQPKPVAPHPTRTLVIAAFLSTIIGVLLALLRERLDDRIRDRDDASRSYGAPVIGALPRGWQGPPLGLNGRRRMPPTFWSRVLGSRLASALRWSDPNAAVRLLEESLALMTLNVEALRDRRRGTAIVVTSTRQEEGKSTVVANLGVALARGGMRVVLVEADPGEPRLHTLLGVDPTADRDSQLALAAGELPDATISVPFAGNNSVGLAAQGRLQILPLGDSPTSLAAILDDEDIARLIRLLREQADFVIFDATPLHLGEAHRFMRASDVALLVARSGWTRRARAQAARVILERLGIRRTAVILTDASADEVLV